MSGFTPTAEQQATTETAAAAKTITVTAGAGTGKTSTMRLAAKQIRGKGLVLGVRQGDRHGGTGARFQAHGLQGGPWLGVPGGRVSIDWRRASLSRP